MDLIDSNQALEPAQRHPWEITRFQFFCRVLAVHAALAEARRVLDVGSGDGWIALQLGRHLAHAPEIVGWDVNYTPAQLRILNQRASGSVRFVRALGEERDFEVLLLLDVLEHVADDAELLSEMVRSRLRPGGRVLVSVPAWPWLYTSHDAQVKHLRRYTPSHGLQLMRGAGLHMRMHGGLFHLPIVVRAAQRLLEGEARAPRRDRPTLDWRGGRLLTWLTTTAFRIDTLGSGLLANAGIALPGLSWWGLGTKER